MLRHALAAGYCGFGAKTFFEKIIASHVVGLAKPDYSIYLYALQELNVKPENTVFIDDNEVNVLAAKKVGMKACLAKGFPEVQRVVDALKQAQA